MIPLNSLMTLLIGLANPFAHAGDNGGGTLKCVSSSGNIKLEGMAGVNTNNGVGYPSLVLTHQNKSLAFTAEEADDRGGMFVGNVQTIVNASYRVQMAYVIADSSRSNSRSVYRYDVLSLRSKAGTYKMRSKDVYTFEAYLPAHTTLDPLQTDRMDVFGKYLTFDADLKCTLDVSL